MIRKIFLPICFCFLTANLLFSQSNLPIRIELEAGKDSQDYHFETGGEKGVLVYYQSHFINKDSANWVFLHYNTDLVKEKMFNLKLSKYDNPVASCSDSSYVYMLFQQLADKSSPSEWFLIRYDLTDKKLDKISFPFNLEEVSYIKVQDDFLFIVTNEDKYSHFCSVDLINRKIYQFSDLKTELKVTHFLQVNPLNRKVYVAFQYVASKKSNIGNAIYFLEAPYDFQGGTLEILPNYSEYQINTVRCAITDSNSVLLLGSYYYAIDGKSREYMHSGFYSLPYVNSKFGDINFLRFSSLMAKDSLSIIQSANNDQDRMMLVGNVFQGNGQFVLTAESYYPEYSQNYSSSMNYVTGFYDQIPGTAFVGYRFINAFVTAFNKKGELLWDNRLPFHDVITRTLYPKVKVYIDDENNGFIYYNFSNRIISTVVNGYEVLEPIYTQNLTTNFPYDEVEYTQNLQIRCWYDHYFLISGYQYIKNPTRGKSKKRYVFSLNKLEYQ